jgi:hypothetical protein
MSSPISAPNQIINNVNTVNTINLPISNKSFTQGINIATIPIENSFLDISLIATTGHSSSISIIKNGLNPENYIGNINTKLHLGSDISNKTPFIGKQTVTIIINVSENETIFIDTLNYKQNKPLNYKTIAIIFLIVFFILNIFM